MNNSKILLSFLIPLFFFSSFRSKKICLEGKWSGTVSFLENKTGTEGLVSEWRMDATLTNDTGRAVHFSNVTSMHGWSRCRTTAKTELELGIDDETNTYSISVNVPGCYGTQVYKGISSDYAVSDETAIVINNRPMGANRNTLSGRLTETHTTEFGSTTTTYEWNLTKSR